MRWKKNDAEPGKAFAEAQRKLADAVEQTKKLDTKVIKAEEVILHAHDQRNGSEAKCQEF